MASHSSKSLKIPCLLLLMVGSCIAGSAWVTFTLGTKALEGVTQPSTNPVQKMLDQPGMLAGESKPMVKFSPMAIGKVEKDVRVYIQNQQKGQRSPKPSPP